MSFVQVPALPFVPGIKHSVAPFPNASPEIDDEARRADVLSRNQPALELVLRSGSSWSGRAATGRDQCAAAIDQAATACELYAANPVKFGPKVRDLRW